MDRILLSLTLLISSISFSQCVELYIAEHLSGDPICNLSNGKSLSICEETKEIYGCPQTFYIQRVYTNSNGFYIYDFALDNIYYAQKYGELQINPKTQKLAIKIGSSFGVYSYVNESQKAESHIDPVIVEKNSTERLKIEDEKTKSAIKRALDIKEYFIAMQLFGNFNYPNEHLELLNLVNDGWKIEFERLNNIYSLYKNELEIIKKDYYHNPSDFLDKQAGNIGSQEILINGKEAFVKFIGNISDPKIKQFFIQFLNNDGYSYTNDYGSTITPVGVNGNYYRDALYADKCIIKLQYDTLVETYLPFIKFIKNNKNFHTSLILNSKNYSVKRFTFPLPKELKQLQETVINSLGEDILESTFPELFFYLDTEEELDLSDCADSPQDVYSRNKILTTEIENLSKGKFGIVTEEFYNPSILYILKQMFPEADSVVFLLGDYRKSVGKFGLHIPYAGYENGNIQPFGSIIPLVKGKTELRDSTLKIYQDNSIFSEILPDAIISESKFSLANLTLESLSMDSLFYRNVVSIGKYNDQYNLINQYPIFYSQLQIGEISNDWNERGKDAEYYRCSNGRLRAQFLPVYNTRDLYFNGSSGVKIPDYVIEPIELLYFNFTSGDKTSELSSQKYLKDYLSSISAYFQYKEEGKINKALKYLSKANQNLELFKQVYFGG